MCLIVCLFCGAVCGRKVVLGPSPVNGRNAARCLVACLTLSRIAGCLGVDFATSAAVVAARRRLQLGQEESDKADAARDAYIRDRQRSYFASDASAKAIWNAAHPNDRYN